jgi:hypothetical protein
MQKNWRDAIVGQFDLHLPDDPEDAFDQDSIKPDNETVKQKEER